MLGQRRDIVHPYGAGGGYRGRGHDRLAVEIADPADEAVLPQPPAQKNLTKPVQRNVEAGASDIAEGQASGIVVDTADLELGQGAARRKEAVGAPTGERNGEAQNALVANSLS